MFNIRFTARVESEDMKTFVGIIEIVPNDPRIGEPKEYRTEPFTNEEDATAAIKAVSQEIRNKFSQEEAKKFRSHKR